MDDKITPWKLESAIEPEQTVETIGTLLMTDFLLPFEVASVLLLGALIGAAVLSKERRLMDSLQVYLIIAAILFSLGMFAVITRRNAIAVLMGVELILNAANLNFIAFARFGGMNITGHIFALFVIVLAAAEVAVALAIIINIYQNFKSINVDEAQQLKQ